jgi:hypothetical protein
VCFERYLDDAAVQSASEKQALMVRDKVEACPISG